MDTINNETGMEAGSGKGDEVASCDARSSQRPEHGRERASYGTALDLRLLPMLVHTGSGDQEGRLVLADGRLVALLVRLDDQAHGRLAGTWFLEAGFGPCAQAAAPAFSGLDAAQEWIKAQIGNDAATAGAAHRSVRAIPGKQAGDPARAAEPPSLPHRLLLGSDDGTMAKLSGDLAAWEPVSYGASFPKDEEGHAA